MRPSIVRFGLALLFVACASVAASAARAADNAADNTGSEFFIVYTDNYSDGAGADLFITSRKSTYGKVEIPGIGFSQDFTVAADSIVAIDIPLEAEVQGSDNIANLGIRVTANNEITAYFLNPGEPVATNDAYVALPVTALGIDYIAMAWPDTIWSRGGGANGPSELAVVAPFDNTKVTITPSAGTGTRTQGVPYTITLNRFQTYTLQGDSPGEDLTGTLIKSTAPIAVFSGNRCADVPSPAYPACDHMIEQMLPTSSWGKAFATIPMAGRSGGDFIRILAAADGTGVTITGSAAPAAAVSAAQTAIIVGPGTGVMDAARGDGNRAGLATATPLGPAQAQLTTTLNRGQFYQINVTGPIEIKANKPVLVAQFGTGQDYGGLGDPLMMLVSPAEQFRANYTFAVPFGYNVNYVTIVAPKAAVASVKLDGTAVETSLFSTIGASGFAAAAVEVGEGSHNVLASAPIGIYVYGFTDYTSYGYVGGLGTTTINPPDVELAPLIVIPGIGGTSLQNSGGTLWLNIDRLCDDAREHGNHATNEFMDVLQLDTGGTKPLLDQDAYKTVAHGSVMTSVTGTCNLGWLGTYPVEPINVYGGLIDYLESQGYVLDKTLFLFGYDWRRDIKETAAELDELIDAHRKNGKVNIIAHSMGGLVARNYILDNVRAAKVADIFLLGSPLLGAPQMFHALYYGDDFGINKQVQDMTHGLPLVTLVNVAHISTLARNWPGTYELLPGPRFFDVYPSYIQEDRDINGDRQASGNFDFKAAKSWLASELNGGLVTGASQFRTDVLEGFDKGTNGVTVTLFVGAGTGTKERLRFYSETKWFGKVTEQHATWRYSNGDGTVPENSADLADEDSSFAGNSTVYYVNSTHNDLPLNRDVQQQIMRVIGGDKEPVNSSISTTNKWPFTANWIQVNSPVDVHVFDALGNHLGPAPEGGIEYGIPNAQYDIIGHDKSVVLPKGITYTVVLSGTGAGDFDLRLMDVVSDSISTSALFKDIPVVTGTIASVVFDPSTEYMMALDEDGDGSVDANIPPTGVLDGQSGSDLTAPVTTIGLEGARSPVGSYVGPVAVTMTADDQGGSGVWKIEYSLDDGATYQVYSGPFTVDSTKTAAIYAKAFDHAGNEESPLAGARLTNPGLYLPAVVK